MKTESVILIAAVAVVAYLLYKNSQYQSVVSYQAPQGSNLGQTLAGGLAQAGGNLLQQGINSLESLFGGGSNGATTNALDPNSSTSA